MITVSGKATNEFSIFNGTPNKSFNNKITSNKTASQLANQNASSIFKDNRYALYSNELSKNYDGVQDFHHKFKQMDQLYSADLGTSNNQDIFMSVNLSLVGDTGKLYGQNNTLDSGISLLVTNIGMIEAPELNLYTLPLDVYDYIQ